MSLLGRVLKDGYVYQNTSSHENTRKGQSKVTKLYSFAWNSIFQVDIFFHPGYPTSSPIKWLRTSRPFNEEQRWHGRKSIFNLTAFSVPPCDNNGTCWIRPSPNTHVHCLQDILVEAPPGHFVNPKQQDSFPEIGKEKRKQRDGKGKLF